MRMQQNLLGGFLSALIKHLDPAHPLKCVCVSESESDLLFLIMWVSDHPEAHGGFYCEGGSHSAWDRLQHALPSGNDTFCV